MICEKCGRELQEDAMFCGFCGAAVENPEVPDYDFDLGEMTEEELELFGDENNGATGSFDEPEEPPIAWCNGNGLGKSEVIEFLEKVVDIQTGEEECKRIMEGLDMEYRDAENLIPPEPMRERPAIRLKKGIIGIIVGLAICNIWINSMIAGIISTLIIVASAWIFIAKPIVDSRKRYAAELTMYNNGTAECEEIRENCRNAYGVVRELGKICGESLDAFYNTEIIKPKYRNLPACAFILEQLENGLTNTLTFEPGDKGAYNKWEDQLYRKAVIGNLDDIRDTVHNIDGKLDLVIQNQLRQGKRDQWECRSCCA